MAEFIDISEHEKNISKSNNEQDFSDNRTDMNIDTNKTQQSEENCRILDEQLSLLLQEKLQLHERGKELETLVSKILEENVKSEGKRLQHAGKKEKDFNYLIRSRLEEIYDYCEKVESHFQKFLDNKRNELRNIRMLSGKDDHVIQEKLALAESMYTAFDELVSTLEILIKHDYDILCHEHLDCINIVIRECNKVEDNCNRLISILLKK